MRLAAIAAFLVAIGCAGYRGNAKTIEPSRLTAEPGWIVAAATPQVRQQGRYDCGAAALAMMAGRWNVPLSLPEATAALPAASAKGTRLGDLRAVARERGLLAFAIAGDRATLVHELEARRPVVVGLLLPYGKREVLPHYEVVIAVHPARDEFVTINPTRGHRVRRWADLDAEWKPAGRAALVVVGTANLDARDPLPTDGDLVAGRPYAARGR